MLTTPPPHPRPRWLLYAQRLCRAALLGYLTTCVAIMVMENRLVYKPVSASSFWQAPPVASWQDLKLRTAAGTPIHAWWCPVPGADGAVIYCHGTDGNLSHRVEGVKQIQREWRASVLIFDYPGYGRSEGSPSERGCYQAGDAVYEWLTREQKVPPENIILFGMSLGGGTATHLADRYPHRALVLAKTFTSLPSVGQHFSPWVPVRWLMHNRFDNLGRVGRYRGPLFVAHGTADDVIPFSHGRQLYAAARGPKSFLSLPGLDHRTDLPDTFYREARRFLDGQAPRHVARVP